MKQPDALFELIKSLNKSEKGYFKKFISIYGNPAENNYLQLFELINKQEEYNENKIKREIGKVKTIKWLSSEKKYLYKLILKSLRNFHAEESIDNQLSVLVSNIEMLHKKALYRQCLKIIIKAKKIAGANEKYNKMLEILKWEKTIYGYSRDIGSKIDLTVEEETKAIKRLENEQQYKSLSYKMSSITYRERHLRNEDRMREVKKLMNSPLLQGEEKAVTSVAKLSYHNLWARYYEIKGDLAKSKAFLKKIIAEIERNSELIIRETFSCISTYNNYLNICLMQNEFEEHKRTLGLLQKQIPVIVRQKPESIALRLFEVQSNHQLALHIGTGNFKHLLSLIPEMEKQLLLYEGKMVVQAEFAVNYNIAYAYIVTAKYRQAKKWLSKLIGEYQTKYSPFMKDVHSFALILNLIVQYELKNYDSLGYYWRSTYRHLFKNKGLFKTEEIILRFFRTHLTAVKSEKEMIPAYKELLNELRKIMKDPFEKEVLNYFDILSWLESKIQNRPFSLIIQSRHNK
jgi:hypothetical protein